MAHPTKKTPIMESNKSLLYASTAMIILTLLKLEDDIRDEKSFSAALIYALLFRAKRKVIKNHRKLYDNCRKQINKLNELEKNNCSDIDALSDVFANLLKILFVPDFIDDENNSKILAYIGYMLGRFIYIIDAYEDIEKDRRKKAFNPFVISKKAPDKDEIEKLLTFNLSSLANTYELLDIKINKPILDNIIYLGLSDVTKKIVKGENENA